MTVRNDNRFQVPGCPFCERIAQHEYEDGDEHSVTFVPLNPVTVGHRLVVPRDHVPDALAAPWLTGRVMRYAASIAASDCNLITSVGAAATQTVRHLHIHIVPRRPGDRLHLPWTDQRLLADVSELADVALLATPWAMGGTPDLAAPECSTHGRTCSDPWDCYEQRVRTLREELGCG